MKRNRRKKYVPGKYPECLLGRRHPGRGKRLSRGRRMSSAEADQWAVAFMLR
jgi:hypothetical protein